MAEGGYKHIKIEYGSRKIVIPYKSHEEFVDKCKTRFDVGQNEDVTFMLPDDDAELDPDCLNDFPNNQTLQIRITAKKIETYEQTEIGSQQVTGPLNKASSRIGPDQRVSAMIASDDRLSFHQESGPNERVSEMKDPADRLSLHQESDDTNTGIDCYEGSMYELSSDEFYDEYSDIQWYKWGDYTALEKHLQMYGTKDIAKLLEDSLEGWRREPVNIAVTGQSGKGKSSLINAFLGLTEVDVRAAPVGEKETTSKCYPYNHPRYANIVFWDIPGCGTQSFPKGSYMSDIKSSKYDFFLIVSSERFHELDIWLAEQILMRKDSSNCYFVRSKVDIDMNNRERRHRLGRGTSTSAELFQEFRLEVITDIIKALGKKTHVRLFLLSSHFPEKYDFQTLQVRLLEDALTSKRCSLTFGMNNLTKKLIKYKGKALRSRQWQIALRSYCSENANNSKVVFPCDTDHIKSEIMFYLEQLSLDQRGLAFVSFTIRRKIDDIRKHVEFESVPSVSTDSWIVSLNTLYTQRYESRSFLKKLEGYFIKKDMTALSTIELFLQIQLRKAMKVSEQLIDFIKASQESLVV